MARGIMPSLVAIAQLKATQPLLSAKDLAGAFVAALLAPNRSLVPPMVVGALFLAGGIANVIMLPSPMWFTLVDLFLAYLPTAWLGSRLAARVQARRTSA